MKKKGLLTAAMAAVMTAGAAMTALAGWEMQNGEWYYYKDSNHEMVTEDWAKSGDFWYYLGDDGKMMTSTFIDETYYVDANGAMSTNCWQYIAEDEWDEEPAWRYFTSNGRVYKDGIRQINGYYYHFEDTKMSTGWVEVEDNTYYFKEDGSMATGWRWLPENEEDAWRECWYYFGSNGKMTKSAERTIDGVKYVFDEYGRMQTGWVNMTDFTSTGMDNLTETEIGNLKFFNESGAAVNGWAYLESSDDYEAHYYYFKDGEAYSSTNKTKELNGYGLAKINDAYYCFDEEGHMVTGMVESGTGPMYFDPENGKMRTGRVTIYDDEYYGEVFYFKENGGVGTRGIGVTGVHDDYLYNNGQAVCAEEGLRYEKVTVEGKDYVVNENGKIKTKGTAKNTEGLKYTITKNSEGGYTITEEWDD